MLESEMFMGKYSVVKNYGHFAQTWSVYANSEEEAWKTAEYRGSLIYQSVYKKPFLPDNKGCVKSICGEENPPIANDQYYEWLREAEQLGMVITQDEYVRCYGLPFENET